jgi:hypothetical protein
MAIGWGTSRIGGGMGGGCVVDATNDIKKNLPNCTGEVIPIMVGGYLTFAASYMFLPSSVVHIIHIVRPSLVLGFSQGVLSPFFFLSFMSKLYRPAVIKLQITPLFLPARWNG